MNERRGAARLGSRGFAGVALVVIASACGSTTTAANASGGGPKTDAKGAQAKLQGTWEIVKYVSKEPIPAEAMPLLGSMFEDLRFKVADEHLEVDGKASPFKVIDDNGDTFRLSTDGMFDKASCRFTSPDEFEVDDQGPTWPGKTVLHREN
jgi:hypothetical protein